MKKIIAAAIIGLCGPGANAQQQDIHPLSDSTKMIDLREVMISNVQKTAQQKLFQFYQSNNTATLEDIISRLPEISLMRRGAYGMEPAIRSFSGGQINVLIDGMRIHGACTDKMDPVTIYIEPANLENLQVKTGSTGFMNGSCIGGTVNMKMAEADCSCHTKITGTVSSGFQTAAKSWYESLWLNYASEKWAIRASGTFRSSSNYRAGSGDIIPFSQYKKVNYSVAAKYQYNERTSLKLDLLGDDGWNIGYPALPMDVGYAAARIGAITIQHQNNKQKLYQWQAKIYLNTVRHYMDDTHRPNVAIHMDMPGKSKTMGFYTEAFINTGRTHKLSIITDASAAFLSASMTMYQPGEMPMYMLTWPDNRKEQYGIAASWQLQIDSSTKLQLNGRTDFIRYALTSAEAKNHVSIFGSSAARNNLLKNIAASISRSINKIKLTASLSYAERMPAASELYGFYLFNASDGYDYIGNPSLKKEKSFQPELSASYNSKFTSFRITTYYARVINYIRGTVNSSYSSMTIGAHGVKTYDNIHSATIMGVEANAVIKVNNQLDWVSVMRYTHANDYLNKPLPFILPFKINNSIRYHNNVFSLQAECENSLAQNRYSTAAGEDATEAYWLLHMRAGYNFDLLSKKTTLSAGVENIFDKKYHEHNDWGNIPRAGRNFYLQLKLSF